MRSCLAGLLKPGHKFKTKTTDYSKHIERNHRIIQKRIWVNIFKVFKFSMSKIEINNFKIHCNALSATLSLNEEFRMLCNICYKRIALKNTCFMFPDVTCISGKEQLISKCPFDFIVWTKLPTKLFLNFCPEIFCTFLGASWKLFGASCRLPCLWYYILSPQEAQKASRKPPGSYKKIQGRNPEIISLVFLSKQ